MASWIWVVGSVIIGLIIFYAGYSLISGQIKNAAYDLTNARVTDLSVELRRICVSEGIGAQRTYEIALPENIKAVYASRSPNSPAPDKVSALISDKKSGAGNYLCYQLEDNEANLPKKCWNFSCTINMTYIGTPTQKMTLQRALSKMMGDNPIYSYRLTLIKVKEQAVLITAEPIIKTE